MWASEDVINGESGAQETRWCQVGVKPSRFHVVDTQIPARLTLSRYGTPYEQDKKHRPSLRALTNSTRSAPFSVSRARNPSSQVFCEIGGFVTLKPSAPLQAPAKVTTWHTMLRRSGYVLRSVSVLQSDQSLSWAPFESPPSKGRPGFSLARAPILCDSVSYVRQYHKSPGAYIRSTIFIGSHCSRLTPMCSGPC